MGVGGGGCPGQEAGLFCQGRSQFVYQLGHAIAGLLIGVFQVGVGIAQVSIGDRPDFAFHLVKDQQVIHLHPQSVRQIGLSGGINGHPWFDPMN